MIGKPSSLSAVNELSVTYRSSSSGTPTSSFVYLHSFSGPGMIWSSVGRVCVGDLISEVYLEVSFLSAVSELSTVH